MKQLRIEINFECCPLDELNANEKELVERAMAATSNAYANYSHFYVGAAVRLANGDIIIGANQENAAFSSGLCAERTAIFAAQAQYPRQRITTLAIAARNDAGYLTDPISPCGACRQVILEIEDRYKEPVRILLYGTSGVYRINSVKDLLPLSFIDSCMR